MDDSNIEKLAEELAAVVRDRCVPEDFAIPTKEDFRAALSAAGLEVNKAGTREALEATGVMLKRMRPKPSDGDHRLRLGETCYTGPVVDWLIEEHLPTLARAGDLIAATLTEGE